MYTNVEPAVELDLTASPWNGFDQSDVAYIRLGAQEYVGTDHQLYVTSRIITPDSCCG